MTIDFIRIDKCISFPGKYYITYSEDNGPPQEVTVDELTGRLLLSAQKMARNQLRGELRALLNTERADVKA